MTYALASKIVRNVPLLFQNFDTDRSADELSICLHQIEWHIYIF